MTGKYALNLGKRFLLLGSMKHCTKRIVGGFDGLPLVFCRVAQTVRHTSIKYPNTTQNDGRKHGYTLNQDSTHKMVGGFFSGWVTNIIDSSF